MAQTTVDGSFITLNTIDGTKLALASQAAGDIMYYNGTDWVRVGVGTDGQVLTVNNAENAPGWEAASAPSDTAYASSWNGVTTIAPSKNAIYDKIELLAPIAGPIFTGTTTFATLSDGTIAVTAWVDEDNMSSNSATLIPTQQSVKAYVDSGGTALWEGLL